MAAFLALIPWLLLVAALPFLLRRRPLLASYPAGPERDPPQVSVILPTRNDATRVGACLATLLDTGYPRYEVLVVDAGSGDGTREIVEALERGAPARIRLLASGPAPAERPWRAWACSRGAREAAGELLLFTEPGTVHDTELLPRAVSALRRERADLLSVVPSLTMEGFWERLVMPHIWLLLSARFPSARRVNRSRSPRGAMVRHQFMLFRREAYTAVGGHGVVRSGALEDLSLAQAVVRAGRRLFLAHGEEYLETRMLRSLAGIRGDWTGAVPAAARSTVAPWLAEVVPWLIAVAPIALFVAPPAILAATLLSPGWSQATAWAGWATALSLVFWLASYARYRIRPAFAVAYPVGALATAFIFVGALLRGHRWAP